MADDGRPHPYLGTDLAPEAYYRACADAYDNPHADGIARILKELAPPLSGCVLDLGCGDGLVTKLLAHQPELRCVGVDRSAEMVARYVRETGCSASVGCFGEPLPAADWIVASYALHLATPQEQATMWWRMHEAGAHGVVVISPFKGRPADPAHYYRLERQLQGLYGPHRKTLYAKWYARR
ncbi:MAG: class I SAM-dependent methyltransferase [Candidatus Sericytochromatia bacterium]|nr:class I SAM-dependent methyltransferase [Candidatus Sericytochromatia bacterium]